MSKLSLSGKSYKVDRENIFEFKKPEETNSYCPVSHENVLSMAEEAIVNSGSKITGIDIGVRDQIVNDRMIYGAKMFSIISVNHAADEAGDEIGIEVGIRNSYDKSMSIGIISGSSVYVCDNMMFTGTLSSVKKHTPNVWDEFPIMIYSVVGFIHKMHDLDMLIRSRFMDVQISTERGLDFLGSLAARNVIPYTNGRNSIFADSIKEWVEPSFGEFKDRNVWSLYNACTHACKKSPFINFIENNSIITNKFKYMFAKDISEKYNEIKENVLRIRKSG